MSPTAPRLYRLLVISPDAEEARVVASVLAARRAEVEIVATLASALRSVREHRYDAVVVSLDLPDSEGRETWRALRTSLPAATPLIVRAGGGEGATIDAALTAREAGVAAWLPVPTPAALLSITVYGAILEAQSREASIAIRLDELMVEMRAQGHLGQALLRRLERRPWGAAAREAAAEWEGFLGRVPLFAALLRRGLWLLALLAAAAAGLSETTAFQRAWIAWLS